MILVFSGSIGRLPLGGHAWVQMQYLAGLQSLGHSVYYLEDCGEESWVYHWDEERLTDDLDYPCGYVRQCLEPMGLGRSWIYRSGDQARGMSVDSFREICSRADLLVIWAVPLTVWREEYGWPARRTFIDADPGFTQVSLVQKRDGDLLRTVQRCQNLFTVGPRIGVDDCPVPSTGQRWHATRPPVALEHWPVADGPEPTHFTSIMQWRGFRDAEHQGQRYGQKDVQFPPYLGLPRRTGQPFRIAAVGAPLDDLAAHGWEAVAGWSAVGTPWSYRSFIQGSRAEFGVAKQGYVRFRAGWFSDRSVCYLASGRPVLVEDTGIGDWLPVGQGIETFSNPEQADGGVRRINGDYDHHCSSARSIAEEYFAADGVLTSLLEVCLN